MSPEPVDVREVGDLPVPMLRSFEWVSKTLESFRERPLPGSYSTKVIPTFDLFGASRVGEMAFESVNGGVGNIEASLSVVPESSYRLYLSFAFQHDDAAGTHVMQPGRILSVGGTFPFGAFADPVRDGAAPNGQEFAVRNIVVPPGGRIAARVEAIAAGAQLFLNGISIDFDVGEPFSSIF